MKPSWCGTGFAVLLIAVSCPTSDCACPPARTAARLFGRVVANGQGVSAAAIRLSSSFDATCGTTIPLDPNQVVTDSAGRFAVTALSIFGPGVQCVRLVAFRQLPQQVDSLVAPPLLVTFRAEGSLSDSTGIVLTFP
jgi:hypothetical protein